MTLGAWIFLSVILILVVLNKRFRKFFFWVAGASAVCCVLFFGYVSVKEWRERKAQAREAAMEQKKQDDCNARLNAGGSRDATEDVFQQLANAERCRANPDITPEEARLLKPGEHLGRVRQGSGIEKAPAPPPNTLPADFFDGQKASHSKSVKGTITNDTVVYSDSFPAGPGGNVLGKVEKGTTVRVIRLDSIYRNVLVRAPNGITGWIGAGDVDY